MSAIRIDRLISTAGAGPSETYDPVSLAGFWQWDLNDEARFSITVPDKYRAGNDLFLRIQESTPSMSARHKWQIKTLLIRPGMHVTAEETASETSTLEAVSPSIADQLASRMISGTGALVAGRVNGVEIAPWDLVSFTLKRVAASSGEDPNPVKVLALSVELYTDETSVSDCAGRTGIIVDTVRDLFNEEGGGFLSDQFILRAINRCQKELAQEDYWRRESWIGCVAGADRTELLTSIPDYQSIHQVHFSGCASPMKALAGFQEYEELKAASNRVGTPQYFVIQNTGMYVWPAPAQDLESGFCVYHSYLPGDITCTPVNPNPPVPKAHDNVFVYFVLKEAFLRDRHAPGADIKFQEYSALYQREKQKLLGEGEPPNLSLRSYR
ncbi:MAG: hypothetical protein HY912_02910 [Desulfomonile tiedjei]|uniref:Uncharacterized protein n=1 Tax=Desulfomonile tiedjei TaxID=2358 RepID=A0A9D6V3C5_9BACT|nr:hypothetical protein [Desulfomonile tiedjei]